MIRLNTKNTKLRYHYLEIEEFLMKLLIIVSSLLVYRMPISSFSINFTRIFLIFYIIANIIDGFKNTHLSRKYYLLIFSFLLHLIISVFDLLRTNYFEFLLKLIGNYFVFFSIIIVLLIYGSRGEKQRDTVQRYFVMSSIIPIIISAISLLEFHVLGMIPKLPFSGFIESDLAIYRVGVIFNSYIYRVAGTFSDPSYYGIYCITIIYTCIYRIARAKNGNMFYWTLLLLNMIMLYFTYSISSYMTLAITSIIIYFQKMFKSREVSKKNVYIIIALLVFILSISLFNEKMIADNPISSQFSMRTENKFDLNNPFINDRTVFFQNAFDAFSKNPIIGIGETNLWDYDNYGAIPVAHNLYLTYLANGGILFGLLKLFMIIIILYYLREMLFAEHGKYLYVGFISILIINLNYYIFYTDNISVFIALVLLYANEKL